MRKKIIIIGSGVAGIIASILLQKRFGNVCLVEQEKKIGGLLIEKYDQLFVVGLGVNFFWKKPEVLSAGALFDQKQSSNFSGWNWSLF